MNSYRFFLILIFAGSMAACRPSLRSPVQTPEAVPSEKPTVHSAAPQPALPPPAQTNLTPNTYSNGQYHFTCTIPNGFVVTHESEGPGEILTVVPQSMISNSTANFSVRTAQSSRLSLEQYVDAWIAHNLQGVAEVAHWDKLPMSHGAFNGFEILVDRNYANGPFKSRIFVLSQGSTIFLLNFSASADQFDANQKVLDQFIKTLSFTP